MVRLHPDDAALYLEGEIYHWFLEQGIDKKAEFDEQEMESTLVVRPASYEISNIL
jgi:hypothetical protein